MPLRTGVQRTQARKVQRTQFGAARRPIAIALSLLLALLGAQAGMRPTPAQALTASAKPKAVIIVGPAATSTSHFLDDGEIMADQAAAAGMDVTRIFHPHATWERVLNAIQGANFVVYMGHGNGWPSPYAPFQERTKDGMGLDGYDGASKYSVTYYGGNPIRDHIKLAKNAVVALVHLCYSSGNGEPGMSIPSWNVARERVDNYAAAFLAAGARSVFSFGWMQKWNLPKALMSTDKTMEQLFETPYHGYPSGWIGWNDRYFDSGRTPGARMHLDPHRTYGFYRSLSGDMRMTASDWRSGGSGGGDTSTTTTTAPSITSLSVVSTDGGTTSALTTSTTTSGSTLPSFHPNGDGLHDRVVMSHALSTAAYLDIKITNSSGTVVRRFTVYAPKGASTSSWGGKNGSGNYVADGIYTLSYKPRDSAGNVGTARSVKVLVLTAVALRVPMPTAIYSRDLDNLAQSTTVSVKLNKTATVTAKVLNSSGSTVRTLKAATQLSAGSYDFVWNGKNGSGGFVATGGYRVVVTGQTSLGTYSEQRGIWVGAFRLDASTLTATRGSKVTFTVYSTEPLSSAPVLDLSQPGLATYTVTTSKVATDKYKVTVTLKSGGSAGTMGIVVRGTDTGGQSQRLNTSITLR